jgi:hypothetical protein
MRATAIGCSLVALIVLGVAIGEPQTLPGNVRDVWFTTSETVSGRHNTSPERRFERVETFSRETDKSVIMVIVFNDHGSHEVSAVRTGPDGKAQTHRASLAPNSGSVRGSRTHRHRWDTSKLKVGTHTVEVVVDDVLIGKYSFELK